MVGPTQPSSREAEVLEALGERLTNAEIAERLSISVRTVESHVSALLRKFQVEDRKALATVALARRSASGPASDTQVADRFIGRLPEIGALGAALVGHRLVTITGPGGAGKTRLAVEIAQRNADSFPDGSFFVDLAPVRDAALVPATLAAAFGVRADEGGDLLEAAADYVSNRKLLVVIDNCEHVAPAAAACAHRLSATAGSTVVLATSREPLRLSTESVFPLGPLEVPDASEEPEIMDASPAVALFVARASAANPDFRLTSDNRAIVRDVCAAVDGLPLALELAAGHVRDVTLRDLATTLASSIAVLDSGPRDAPSRQQAMAAAIEWSYDLLDSQERVLFERLSVFAGSFSGEAVCAVCGFAPISEVSLPMLGRLVAKSLVVLEGGRYRLLEPIRQFASARLAASSDAEITADRHLGYFAELTGRLGIGYRTAGTPATLDVIRTDEANVRAALTWAFDGGRDRIGSGVELVSANAWRWFVDGMLDEAAIWCGRAAARSGLTDRWRLLTLYGQAIVALGRADLDAAVAHAEEILRLAAAPESELFRVFGFEALGVAAWAQGRLDESEKHLTASAEMAARLDLRWHEAFTQTELARVFGERGDEERAARVAAEGARIATAIDEPMPLGLALEVLARQAFARQDYAATLSLVTESLDRYREVGYREGIASATHVLARTLLALGDSDAAQARAVDVIDLHRQLGHRAGLAAAFETVAELRAQSDPQNAAVFLGVARHLREQVAVPGSAAERAAVERVTAAVAARLGPSFDDHVRRGTLLRHDDAIDLARR